MTENSGRPYCGNVPTSALLLGAGAHRQDARGPRGARRGPGLVYSSLSTALLVLIAAIAITAQQQAPPAIAELVPQPRQQITEAPIEQSSRVGTADGGGPGGGPGDAVGGEVGPPPTTTTTAALAAAPRVERARVRRCVGDPPRQIEDPQSPPCVPFWEGDNGGATYQGVTAEEIVVVMGGSGKDAARFQTFFNKRFEFYGRRLRLVARGGPGLECQANIAAATAVDEEVHAFAGIGLYDGNEWCYLEELARRKLLAITESVFPDELLAPNHPYVWQYPSETNSLLTALGQWTCARLAGRPAAYADGTYGVELNSQRTRSFGLILQPYGTTYTPDPAPLERELARCGAKLDETVVFPYSATSPELSTNAVLRMKSSGITSAYCICTVFQNQYLAQQASSQGWFPEWLFSSFGLMDANSTVRIFWNDAQQRANVMGITAEPRQWPFDQSPAIWALQEADPTFNVAAEGGSVALINWERGYRMLLLLASGIQLAGPNLTPETFAAGLQRARFPNPDHPLLAGRVGFESPRPDHSMTDDYAEFFWSEAGRGPYGDEGVGSLCYVDGGRRRALGAWPTGDDVFFTPQCDSGVDGPGDTRGR